MDKIDENWNDYKEWLQDALIDVLNGLDVSDLEGLFEQYINLSPRHQFLDDIEVL